VFYFAKRSVTGALCLFFAFALASLLADPDVQIRARGMPVNQESVAIGAY
jgi:hypothetical protein